MNLYKKILVFVLFFVLLIITFSSLLNIYEKRGKIKKNFLKSANSKNETYAENNKEKYDLANKILTDGGYILHFRHAHREKWIDVTMYDSVEINERRRAENEYFKDAVCLSSMGMIQAKMMGEIWKSLNVPVSKVFSSPSCRARQTSELVFGGYDEERSILLHKGPYKENFDEFAKDVKEFYLNIKMEVGKNVIVSGHNGLINEKLFDNIEKMPNEFFLEEGGFYVLKKVDDKLVFIDKFHFFQNFNLQFKKRPKY
jgi:phosphohistidine phosphatase SixA